MRILIIDDNRTLGESLTDLINSRGHEAYYASGLDEARWLCELLHFSLALVDFDMPQQSGPEVAERLREAFPNLKAVVMSAHAITVERRRQLGDLPFLQKPLASESLFALIDHLILQGGGSSLVRRTTFALKRYSPKKS